ncbi:MAG: hypothetical protein EOP45_23265 [Sphingobacteriaceae bacterium]|nr:MAG: hypothetical protein EOP45_23265 [Sphingobacteriaceae bacterium]
MVNSEVFQEVKKRIGTACKEKNYLMLNLEALGFLKRDLNEGKVTARLFHDLFTLKINDSQTIEVEYRCYDQSKPFQILPDMNKIEARLMESNLIVDKCYCSYED